MAGIDDQTPESVEAGLLSEEGYALLEMGRFEEASERLFRARALAPFDPRIHYRLALLFGDTGRLSDALAALDKSIELQPDNARAHNNRGSILYRLERLEEAEAAYRRALNLDPNLEQANLNLGEILERHGKMTEAVQLYESAIANGLNAELFGHRIAAAAGRATDRAPDGWVRATFDNFAPSFDSVLSSLGYAVPQQLATALMAYLPAGALDIVDLGCGTGQCGLMLAKRKRYLVGVDLSDRMLARARSRGLYDELCVAEVHEWLRNSPATRFDVVIAADVLIYIGVLVNLFKEVARVLRVGGCFAFSTEECEGAAFLLLPTGRYAHSQSYVRHLADAAFAVIATEGVTLRTDRGRPIAGRLYLLTKRAA